MKNWKRAMRRCSGITMIEAMITIGIIGFVMSLIVVMTNVGVTAWKRQYTRLKMEQDAQAVMNHLSMNLRQARANSVVISRWNTKMDYSLISFDRVDAADLRHYYFLRTVGTGETASRNLMYSMPSVDGAGVTVWSETILATNVMHLFFTFPNYNNRTQILANATFRRLPFRGKAPVVVQAKEIIYARD